MEDVEKEVFEIELSPDDKIRVSYEGDVSSLVFVRMSSVFVVGIKRSEEEPSIIYFKLGNGNTYYYTGGVSINVFSSGDEYYYSPSHNWIW